MDFHLVLVVMSTEVVANRFAVESDFSSEAELVGELRFGEVAVDEAKQKAAAVAAAGDSTPLVKCRWGCNCYCC